jgi:hypothetical protein
VLITKTIADVEQTINAEHNVDLRFEGKQILRDLAILKEDMENDRPLWYTGERLSTDKQAH